MDKIDRDQHDLYKNIIKLPTRANQIYRTVGIYYVFHLVIEVKFDSCFGFAEWPDSVRRVKMAVMAP